MSIQAKESSKWHWFLSSYSQSKVAAVRSFTSVVSPHLCASNRNNACKSMGHCLSCALVDSCMYDKFAGSLTVFGKLELLHCLTVHQSIWEGIITKWEFYTVNDASHPRISHLLNPQKLRHFLKKHVGYSVAEAGEAREQTSHWIGCGHAIKHYVVCSTLNIQLTCYLY